MVGRWVGGCIITLRSGIARFQMRSRASEEDTRCGSFSMGWAPRGRLGQHRVEGWGSTVGKVVAAWGRLWQRGEVWQLRPTPLAGCVRHEIVWLNRRSPTAPNRVVIAAATCKVCGEC
jgi:hypothetical protein